MLKYKNESKYGPEKASRTLSFLGKFITTGEIRAYGARNPSNYQIMAESRTLSIDIGPQLG